MDNSLNAKQQIVERVKQSTNILVTVNSNPSVDALSAALAFTLMLNKLDKHATAVFSGAVPPAIKFLEPDKTFENKVDSLRDFIIALDKEKADRLRYKVENDVVKIFITPYRTSISEKDLHFSQGDFNVDLIIALGVERREELDRAIIAHGRILHDATVMTINAGNQKSSLGIVDWQESTASSLCEMLLALCEALQSGLLDQQLSTALLTGIVAATERFSNQLTTPRVMTMAAQLMAAGANQQLIATNLRSISTNVQPPMVSGGPSTKIDTSVTKDGNANGEMHIKHEDEQAQAALQPNTPLSAPVEPEIPIAQPAAAAFNDLKQALETATNEQQAPAKQKQPQKASKPQRPPKRKEDVSYMTEKPSWMGRTIQPPSMGGTLNATAEEALENRLKEEADERNRTLLTHNEATEGMPESPAEPIIETPEQTPAEIAPAPAPAAPAEEPAPASEPVPEPQPAPAEPAMPVPAEQPPAEAVPAEEPVPQPTPVPAPTPELPPMPDLPQSEPSLEELEHAAKAHAAEAATPEAPAPAPVVPAALPDVDAARQAVNDALESAPESPVVEPAESIGARDFAPVAPEASAALPTPLPAPVAQNVPAGMNAQTAPQSSGLPLPPLPDFSTLPPLPPQPPLPDTQVPPMPQQQPQLPPLPQTPPPAEPTTPDPHQFKIPGA